MHARVWAPACVFMRVCAFFNGYMLSNIAETEPLPDTLHLANGIGLRKQSQAKKTLEVSGIQVSLTQLNQPNLGAATSTVANLE